MYLVVCFPLRIQSLQSRPTLFDPIDLAGSSIHRILLSRILEWIAMPSSRGSSQPRDQSWSSCISIITDRFLAAGKPCFPLLECKPARTGPWSVDSLLSLLYLGQCLADSSFSAILVTTEWLWAPSVLCAESSATRWHVGLTWVTDRDLQRLLTLSYEVDVVERSSFQIYHFPAACKDTSQLFLVLLL